MPRAGRLAVALTLALVPGAGAAQAPLSAIDWLSRSVATPPERQAALPPLPGRPVDAVQVTPLEALARDGAGLRPAAAAGLPRGLWGVTPAAELTPLIAAERTDAVPALRALFETVLTTALTPPADAAPPGAFLFARVDKLLAMGALASADALLVESGDTGAETFRRRFDIALLTGTEDAACASLRETPEVAPTYPVRIFCLARGGDWQAAGVTLDTARALGAVEAAEVAVLTRFIDLEADDDPAPLAAPPRPTPLTLRLYEAVGEPIATGDLPLAFAHADLAPTNGWKARIDAGERLARAGALAPDALLALYTERQAAASGGAWDRVRAVQRLDAALAARDAAAVAAALPVAEAAMRAAELEVPFAVTVAPRLEGLALTGAAAALAFRLHLLTPDFGRAAALWPADGPEAAFLAGLARGSPDPRAAPGSLGRAIAPAFAPDPAPLVGPRLAAMLDGDRRGEALLRAIERINDGATGDLRGVTEGLAVLRRLGLEAAAREVALQLLLIDRRG